jgi:hypothetical protein
MDMAMEPNTRKLRDALVSYLETQKERYDAAIADLQEDRDIEALKSRINSVTVYFGLVAEEVGGDIVIKIKKQ